MEPTLFRSLMDRLNDAVLVIDAKTSRLVDVNARACQNLRYTRDELLGLGVIDIEAALPSDFHWEGHAQELRAVGSMIMEGTHRRKDGTTFPVEASLSYVDAGGRGYVLAVARDITERKRLEADLKQAIEVAEAANRAKTDFLAAMSHELRTPLTLVLGPIEARLQGQSSDVVSVPRADLERVARNAARLRMLVDDVLDYSKADAGHLALEWEPVWADEALRELVEDVRPAAEARGVRLAYVGPAGVRVGAVSLDRKKFDKIALNLLGNAIKFTPEGGEIEVGLKAKGDTFQLWVLDNGIGIARDKLPLLFQRFQQVDTSRTRRYGGTGLGLALVKQFAELMSGSVSVESDLGEGSCFVVTLPRREAVSGASAASRETIPASASRPTVPVPRPAVAPAGRALAVLAGAPGPASQAPGPTSRASGAAVRGGRPRVVLAEDNADLRAYVVDLLAGEFDVEAFGDGARALEAVRASEPDVIVSDVMMPRLDGFELVRALRDDVALRHLPVILLTAHSGREAAAFGLDAGADDYLSKPFGPAELVARVRAACRLQGAHRELLRQGRALAEVREKLAEAEKLSALGRMLAQLSHEINNPLNVAQNNVAPLREYLASLGSMLAAYRRAEAGLGAEGRALRALWSSLDVDFILGDFDEALRGVDGAVRRVTRIQSDLRTFLRGGPVEREAADVNEALRSTLELVARQLPPGVSIAAEYGALPSLDCNAGQISQVLWNLVQNAVEAVGERGSITCRTSAGEGRLRVEIEDDGPGVPEALRAKLFEAFFTTKPAGRGTGLGLAICRQLVVENHGGRLWLDERSGGGARFVVELPQAPAAERPAGRPSRVPPRPSYAPLPGGGA